MLCHHGKKYSIYHVSIMIVTTAILDLESKMDQKHINYHFIKFVMPYLVQIDTLYSIFGQLVRDTYSLFFFGGHLGIWDQGGYESWIMPFHCVSDTEISGNWHLPFHLWTSTSRNWSWISFLRWRWRPFWKTSKIATFPPFWWGVWELIFFSISWPWKIHWEKKVS